MEVLLKKKPEIPFCDCLVARPLPCFSVADILLVNMRSSLEQPKESVGCQGKPNGSVELMAVEEGKKQRDGHLHSIQLEGLGHTRFLC